MFKNKKATKKVEVKSEGAEQEIKINIKPLVTIEKHESRINGKVQAPEFKIMVGGRDCILLNSREYKKLFSEMLYRMDNDEIMHALYEKHAMEHAEVEATSADIGRMFHKVVEGGMIEKILKDLANE